MRSVYGILILILFSCNPNEEKAGPSINSSANDREARLLSEIKQYPDSGIVKENLIQYYREAGNYQKAISVTLSYAQAEPKNPRWFDIAGTLDYENNDTSGAIKNFEQAINLYPDPQYVISLGSLYAYTKNARALDMADALLAADKANAQKEAYFIKGLYYTNKGNKAKAVEFFDKCLQESYTFMDAYIEKALALYDMQKYREAVAVLDKATTVQNNFDEAFYYKGMLLEKLSRTPEAIRAYESALLYNADNTDAADALKRLGAR